MPDEQIVQLLLGRDVRALAALMRRCGGQVNTVCRNICTDASETNDVVSLVSLEFWNDPAPFQLRRNSLGSYLLISARRRAADCKRVSTSYLRPRSTYIDTTAGDGNEPAMSHVRERQALSNPISPEPQQALCELSDLQRQALQIAFFDGMSHREVAGFLQITLRSVMPLIRSGLLRLRGVVT